MISIQEYSTLISQTLDPDWGNNLSQISSVEHDGNNMLMLVAGPGSGKTRVLVLRALRHVLVDDILPEELLITTFTRKAAKELRTRWLDWGTTVLGRLSENNPELRPAIRAIDLNRCRIDTLDSIAQQALTEFKLPGEIAPILAEGASAKLMLKRNAFAEIYRANREILDPFLARYTFEGDPPRNQGEALSTVQTLCERLVQDRTDLESYANENVANSLIVEIFTRYKNSLTGGNIFDFALLEERFHERLQGGSLPDWTGNIRALLIDEYQDTNPLQEAIYYAIIQSAAPMVTIVGDDDQSMYRFRGGSVELFTQFAVRSREAMGLATDRIDMVANYRSSNEIVGFYNSHIVGDPDFLPARILPPKPEVVANRGEIGMPVLGMFRSSPEALADSLAEWLHSLRTNRISTIDYNGSTFEIRLPETGDLGDCVLLSHSVEEIKYDGFIRNTKAKFTRFLRDEMATRGMEVFNPRGNSLRTILSVQRLLGMLLLCIDPDGKLTPQVFPTNQAHHFLNTWRATATAFINSSPVPQANGGLQRFVADWQAVMRGGTNQRFPDDWPALRLLFKLIAWIPSFQGDPEHQVWLEAITRAVSSAGVGSPYGMQIHTNGEHRERSAQSVIRDALLPIAENEVDVDEDIMPSVPRDRLQIMTIHQSKGLEFPLVIVDVGSQFTSNHHTQRFLRFPDAISNVVKMEEDVEPHLAAPLRIGRRSMDRVFDDLARLYYVAYSRPQSVLMLVGCEKCLQYGSGRNLDKKIIPSVALGWRRDGVWPWRQEFQGRRKPIRVEPPFALVGA